MQSLLPSWRERDFPGSHHRTFLTKTHQFQYENSEVRHGVRWGAFIPWPTTSIVESL